LQRKAIQSRTTTEEHS